MTQETDDVNSFATTSNQHWEPGEYKDSSLFFLRKSQRSQRPVQMTMNLPQLKPIVGK